MDLIGVVVRSTFDYKVTILKIQKKFGINVTLDPIIKHTKVFCRPTPIISRRSVGRPASILDDSIAILSTTA
jgi:hypothetical protein